MPQLSFSITEEQLRELTKLAGTCHEEAERHAAAHRWADAIKYVGSSIEAALLATICIFEPELREEKLWNPPNGDPTHWPLGGLLKIARKAGWLPVTMADSKGDLFTSLSGDIGDATDFMLAVRNMSHHPGAYIREQLRPDFENEQHMQPTYEIIHGIYDMVIKRLIKQIDTLGLQLPA